MAPRDPDGTAQSLRQTEDTTQRRLAITRFGKGLRHGKRFQLFWDAIGGAQELAYLMASFSLRDVKAMCICLGQTAGAPSARLARRTALGELLSILLENRSATGTELDSRPLLAHYQNIAPACNLDVVQQWETQYKVQWTDRQNKYLLRGHSDRYEEQFMQDTFSKVGAERDMCFADAKWLTQSKIELTQTLLTRLIERRSEISRIPEDLVRKIVLPALKRQSRRRHHGGEAQDELLLLVTRGFQMHSGLAKHNHLGRGSVIYYAALRWLHVREDSTASTEDIQRATLILTQLLSLLTYRKIDGNHYRLSHILEWLLLVKKRQDDGYELLRLSLQHINDYNLDIGDDSPEGLARLKAATTRGNLWPPELFFCLKPQDALDLFERLSASDVTGNFLRHRYGGLMNQGQDEGDAIQCGDVAILRCLLLNRAEKEPARSQWADRARVMVQQRRKKSQESRESQGRAFWAKAALNLSIAIGDLEVVDDTLVWARRYNNEPLVVKEFYSACPISKEELVDLMAAVPRKLEKAEDRYTDEDVAAAQKQIELSGRILVHLAETMKMTFSQKQISYNTWGSVVSLMESVARRRVHRENTLRFNALFGPTVQSPRHAESPTVDALWKPYLKTMVMIEAIMDSAPYRHQFEARPASIFKRIGFSGTTTADLLGFLMATMKAQLSPETLKTRMPTIVGFVTDIARSQQPWLAFPFIRDIVIDGDGGDSTWYRQLLSYSFLANLPAKMASDCLHMLGDTMKVQMRKQASRPAEVIGENGEPIPSAPAIKVTTVKMMAEILRGTELISPPAACDLLLGLLAEARHIDIRVALVSSLLSILKHPSTLPEIHTRILDALEASVEPVLAQLSERRPVTEEQWAAAEQGQEPIPDIGQETQLFTLLTNFADENRKLLPAETLSRMLGMLFRVPASSVANNARWNKLFLARNGFALDQGENIPACPVFTSILDRPFRLFGTRTPASTLGMLRELAIINLDPTPGILRVNEAIRLDGDLLKSNAGKHWLAQFGHSGASGIGQFGVYVAALALYENPKELALKLVDGQGITVPMLQEFVLAVYDRLIAIAAPQAIDTLVSEMCSCRSRSLGDWQLWRQNAVPVLEAMITKVEDLRLKQVSEPNAAPQVLPKTFTIRSWLLPVPFAEPKDAASEWATLASEIAKLLEWLTGRKGMPYHEEFAQLKKDLSMRVKKEHHTSVALLLGRLEPAPALGRELALADYLRLELAGHLLCGALNGKERSSMKEEEIMVEEWVQSRDEVVCAVGLPILIKIREKERKV